MALRLLSLFRLDFPLNRIGIPLAADVTPEWLVETIDDLSGAGIAGLCTGRRGSLSTAVVLTLPATLVITSEDIRRAIDHAHDARQHRERPRTLEGRSFQ